MTLWLARIVKDDMTSNYLYISRERMSESKVRNMIYHALWPDDMFTRPFMALVKCSKEAIWRLNTQNVLKIANGAELIPIDR